MIELGVALARATPGGEPLARELESLALQSVIIRSVEAQMRFDVSRFYVEAGRPVAVTFANEDVMQHNLVITAPGTYAEVGKAADALGANGFAVHFVPKLSEVLHSTKLVDPRKAESLIFEAPAQAADYDFVCTFPGHWIIMNGKMTVVPRGDPRAGRTERGDAGATQTPASF